MAAEALRLKRRPAETLISVDRFDELSLAQVERLRHKSPRTGFAIRAKLPEPASLARLARTLKETVAQAGFIARREELTPPAAARGGLIGSRRPKSRAELRYYLAKTYLERFAEPWAEYFGRRRLQDNLDVLLSVSTTDNSTFAMRDDEPVGMVVCFPYRDCAGTPVLQVGWIWVDERLGKADRARTHAALCRPLAASKYKILQAGIHLKNARSQKFFMKLGFFPKCVHFDPLQP